MKLEDLLKDITPLPWSEHALLTLAGAPIRGAEIPGEGSAKTIGDIITLQDKCYLLHAVNVLPELLAAAKNLQENWEHNLTEPMARLSEAIEIAEDVIDE